jgi:hypothetical protein
VNPELSEATHALLQLSRPLRGPMSRKRVARRARLAAPRLLKSGWIQAAPRLETSPTITLRNPVSRHKVGCVNITP